MAQARRSTSSSSRSQFKQPPALKRLSTSLDTAQRALTELSKGGGRDLSKGARDLYTDLRAFVTNARRDSNKLGKALQREFDQAQKELTKAAQGKRSSTGRSTTSRSTTKRSTSSRSGSSTSSRSSSSRSTTGRSTSRRSSGSGTAKRGASSGSRRSSGGSGRGSSSKS